MIYTSKYCKCQCSKCGKDGWEGCPKSDAEEKIMELEREIKRLKGQLKSSCLFSECAAILSPNKAFNLTKAEGQVE